MSTAFKLGDEPEKPVVGYSLDGLAARARDWLNNAGLPFWATHGLDAKGLGFHEDLTLNGQPGDKAYKRMRAQCRQTYVFAEATMRGWNGPAEAAMWAGYDFITTHGRNADGTWARLLGRNGGIIDATPDLYDHAFVLFACAAVYRATRSDAVLATLRDTHTVIQERFALDGGIGYRAELPTPEHHRQNPHMHLLEAYMAAFEATGDDRYMSEAAKVVDLFQTAFYDATMGRLFEDFDQTWQPTQALLEPGHHFEWVWLLDRFAKLGGHALKREMTGLYNRACIGMNPQTGLIVDAMDIRGNVRRASSRCWPNTEALKAHISIKTRFGLPLSAAIAHSTEQLLNRYLGVTPYGGWMDQFDAVGNACATAMPASTFYHVLVAFTELFGHVSDSKTAG
jgi:mannose/cellobiose epimerase-like protein (N-acyl-D-glucosamine 2-epimerase family)